MEIKKYQLQYVKASDLFNGMETDYQGCCTDLDYVYPTFCNKCRDISWGGNEYTLVSIGTIHSIVKGYLKPDNAELIEFTNRMGDLGEDMMVDLEN